MQLARQQAHNPRQTIEQYRCYHWTEAVAKMHQRSTVDNERCGGQPTIETEAKSTISSHFGCCLIGNFVFFFWYLLQRLRLFFLLCPGTNHTHSSERYINLQRYCLRIWLKWEKEKEREKDGTETADRTLLIGMAITGKQKTNHWQHERRQPVATMVKSDGEMAIKILLLLKHTHTITKLGKNKKKQKQKRAKSKFIRRTFGLLPFTTTNSKNNNNNKRGPKNRSLQPLISNSLIVNLLLLLLLIEREGAILCWKKLKHLSLPAGQIYLSALINCSNQTIKLGMHYWIIVSDTVIMEEEMMMGREAHHR